MTKHAFTNIEQIEQSVGNPLGTTDWRQISQDDVNTFADVTEDHQWIHIDVERAAQSIFGGTIVHGFFTLAFLPGFAAELYQFDLGSARLNFGLEKVRFLAPLPVGDRIRGSAEFASVRQQDSGTRVHTKWTIEREGGDRPVCIAESITLIVS